MPLASKDGKLVVKGGKLCSSCCDDTEAIGCCYTYSLDNAGNPIFVVSKDTYSGCEEAQQNADPSFAVVWNKLDDPSAECPENPPDPDPDPDPESDIGMCCYLDDSGTVCDNTTRQDCDDLSGNFFPGYTSEACKQGEVDVLCRQPSPCEDGVGKCGEQCVSWTVTLNARNYVDGLGDERLPTPIAESYTQGSPPGGYPASLRPQLNPPWGPNISGYTPDVTINWIDNEITLKPGEVGFLQAEITVSRLISQYSHSQELFAAGLVPDPGLPLPSSPAYDGSVDINVSVQIPVYVAGCAASGGSLWIGEAYDSYAELPGNVDRLVGTDGGPHQIEPNKEFYVGKAELKIGNNVLRNITLPICDCNGTCTTEEKTVSMNFGGGADPAVKWWPSGEARAQDNFYLGTRWSLNSLQVWQVTLKQNVIDCTTPSRSNPLP